MDRRGARGAGSRGADLVEHDGRLGDTEARAPVLFGDDHPEPARLPEGLHPVPRVLGLLVLLQPVVQGEGAREGRDLLADQLLLLGQLEVHARHSSPRRLGWAAAGRGVMLKCRGMRSEEHTSELQSLAYLVCRLLLEKKKQKTNG